MGLINLKTDLKSLRYGNDRVFGGDSGQPYITNNIPDDLSPYIGTTDYILRGGIRVVRDSVTDVERLAKMFKDVKSPNGIFFTTKQQLLSATAVRTQASGILNEGIYSPLNTLAQAGVIAFGSHLNKQGINPFAETGVNASGPGLYYSAVTPNQDPSVNRLVLLATGSSTSTTNRINGFTLTPPGGVNILTYSGGPNSDKGVGTTTIQYSSTSKTALSAAPEAVDFGPMGSPAYAYSSKLITTPYITVNPDNSILEGSPIRKGSYASPKIQDFRVRLRTDLRDNRTELQESLQSGATALSVSYSTKNVDLRTNQGQPGQRQNNNYKSYSDGVKSLTTNQSTYGVSGSVDKLGAFADPGLDFINSTPVYRSENVSTDPKLNDLVKFTIAIIDNDSPNFSTFMHFRAFLGNISDAYSAEWGSFRYLGRGENFYTYNGFTRQMSLSWTVAAQSKQELIPMYKKLNYLASSVAPNYSGQGYMRGNLAQITIGDYIVNQPGIITGLTYDMQEDSPWEIGIQADPSGNIDTTTAQMPHIIRVSGFNFIPIQQFIPSKQTLTFANSQGTPNKNDDTGFANGYGIQRFISLRGSDSYGGIVTANS
jgi:hypothetical protein